MGLKLPPQKNTKFLGPSGLLSLLCGPSSSCLQHRISGEGVLEGQKSPLAGWGWRLKKIQKRKKGPLLGAGLGLLSLLCGPSGSCLQHRVSGKGAEIAPFWWLEGQTLAPCGGWRLKQIQKRKRAPFGGWRTKKTDSSQFITPGTACLGTGSDRIGPDRIIGQTGVRAFSCLERASGALSRVGPAGLRGTGAGTIGRSDLG
jgi:hypothetical protein